MHQKLFYIDIKSLKRGDKKVYESVYFEFFDVLYHLALQYLRREDIAKEVVQDAFVKLWENKGAIENNSNIKNLLYTITKNNCLNHLRNEKVVAKYLDNIRHLELQFQYDALSKLSDDAIIFEELQEKLNAAIEKLPEKIKQVFIMSRFQELKYREIADKLSISQKTVESRMSKALAFLRKDLKEYLPFYILLSEFLN
ncbi:RNA polymerase sigma-70 factor [Labilibacter marinus]|uniref:RNA polymerase sigma-70 factor n=1 Tax=Labilibacter marinus TaxID=1477105 RepID=UPI0008295CE9|nr:RNA polymerase sigma-70 factor [Labilibacter marinus]